MAPATASKAILVTGDRGSLFRCPGCQTFGHRIPDDVPFGYGVDVDYTFECDHCRSLFALMSGGTEECVFELAVKQSEYRVGVATYKGLRVAADPHAEALAQLPPALLAYRESIEALDAAQRALEAHAAEVLAVLSTRDAANWMDAAGIDVSRSTLHRQAQAHLARAADEEVPDF